MKSNFSQIALMMCLAFICSFGFSISASAQEETSATITGQVTDSTGAAIPNATVVVVEMTTNAERRVQTNDEGSYTVSPLIPGTYTITVEQAGFKRSVINATLNARDRRPIQIVLEAGGANETVTVTDEAPLLQDSATGQTLVSGNQVTELPLNNRNFIRLLETIPGVSSDLDDESSFGLTSRASVSINGLRRNAVNYLVDGVSNTDVGSNITLLSTPTVDSIKEFKVLTSNYTAEIGRSGGGAVIIVTRGGGNEYRGNLYEFVRNDRFNANSFFNNRQGRNATTGLPVAPVPKLRYNNFGGTFGGPIPFLNFGEGGPVWTSGKNKTFFFYSHEQRRIIRGITDASATVPSLLQRQGNFSTSLQNTFFCRLTAAPFTVSTTTTAGACAAGAEPVTVGTSAGGTIQAQAGQIYNAAGLAYAGNIIPTSNIDPRSLALLQAYPLPNSGTNGFTFTPIGINNTQQNVIRIDHNFNNNHRVFGRYTKDVSATREAQGLFGPFSGFPDISTSDTRVPGQVFALSYTGIFSNSVVNELTYNYSHNIIDSELIGRGRRSDYLGANAIQEIYPENGTGAIPTIGITGISTIGAFQGFAIEYGNHTIRDVLTYTRGNHIFKFGGEATWESKNENANSISQGSFAFAAAQTQGRFINPAGGQTLLTNTGNAFASFLLGQASGYTEANTDLTVNERFGRREFFVQDTWKVRPNLTLDIGVRYQYFIPITDVNNTIGSFDPALYTRPSNSVCVNPANCTTFNLTSNPTTGATALNLQNGIGLAGSSSRFGRAIAPADKNNFSPRVGLAWDPFKDGKTIVRAGYGFYYDQPLVGIFEQAAFTTPGLVTIQSFTSTPFNPAQTVTFSNPSAGAPPSTIGLRGVIAIANDFKTPETQVYSIGVQREVFKNAVIDVSYVGTKADNLIRRRNINFLTPEQVLNNGLTGSNILRPYLGFGAITYIETSAKSRYNGFLSSFQYRFATGFTITAAYTLSKTMTDVTNDRDAIDDPQNPFDTRSEYAEARTSRRHVFSSTYVYELPFFRKSENTLARLFLGGYQISGITQIESGAPVPRVAIADTGGGIRGSYPDLIGDPRGGLAGTIDPVTGLPFIFDPTAFAFPANGTFGNAGRAFARLPGRFQTNLTLSKNIYFDSERKRYLQLRAEGYNIFNQTQFTVIPGNSTTLPTAGPLTNSLFGRPTGTRLPREFQFGAKLYF